jgi:hypothetical protein
MSDQTSLQAQLDAAKEGMMKEMPDEVKEIIGKAMQKLGASGVIDGAIKEGDTAPDFVLPNAKGISINLKSEYAKGPVILKFYRGGW